MLSMPCTYFCTVEYTTTTYSQPCIRSLPLGRLPQQFILYMEGHRTPKIVCDWSLPRQISKWSKTRTHPHTHISALFSVALVCTTDPPPVAGTQKCGTVGKPGDAWPSGGDAPVSVCHAMPCQCSCVHCALCTMYLVFPQGAFWLGTVLQGWCCCYYHK